MEINIKDLKKMIKEMVINEINEFKPNAVIDNKEGEKFYKETSKKVKGHEDIKGLEREDFNKTTMDYTFDGEVSKEYKDRVKAQALGYTSKMEMDNETEKSGDYENNKQIYGDNEKVHKTRAKAEKNIKQSGLAASKLPSDIFDENDLFESKQSYERLNFTNSVFLNESHMKTKIPSSYKVNGKKFIMKDSNDNEYIVEWKQNDDIISEAYVINYRNKTKSDKDLNRVNELFKYSNKSKRSNPQQRIVENTKFKELLNKNK